jgi:hypothetical protein
MNAPSNIPSVSATCLSHGITGGGSDVGLMVTGTQTDASFWGAGLKNPVVFDGQYVSCETHFAVAADELKLKAPSDSMQMWVGVPSEERLAPAIFLQNGEHLVPIEATHGCEELMEKLKPKP